MHIGHWTGGGQATRYVARYGQPQGSVAKLVLIGAVPPIMVKTAANPGGLPIEVFDGLRQQLAANRSQFYLDFASGPFYNFDRLGAKPVPGVMRNWWRQAMMGRRSTTASRLSRRRISRMTPSWQQKLAAFDSAQMALIGSLQPTGPKQWSAPVSSRRAWPN